jgi:hypothetical protein
MRKTMSGCCRNAIDTWRIMICRPNSTSREMISADIVHLSDLLSVIHIHNALLSCPLLHVQVKRCLSEDIWLRCISVEHFGDLLKSATFSLREEEVDGWDHRGECSDIYEVELPGNGFECDRVAELVENFFLTN